MKFFLYSLIAASSLFVCVVPAFASTPVLPAGGQGTCDCPAVAANDGEGASEACKKYCGVYQLNDGLALVKKIVMIFLGISGGLALMAFVAGGFMFLFSAGNKNWVERGKATIIGAAIGLVIVFFSYTIVKYVFDSLTKNSGYQDNPFQSGMDNSQPSQNEQ